jgi:hypothetical protein
MSRRPSKLLSKFPQRFAKSEVCLQSIGKYLVQDSKTLIMQLLSKDSAERSSRELRLIVSYLETLEFIQKVIKDTSRDTVMDLARCVITEHFKAGEVLHM